MPIVTLNAAFCQMAQSGPGKKKTDYYSDTQSGFGLECRPSGKKTYFQRYTVNGRLRQKAIAAYGEVTFEQAKKAGQRLRSEAVLGGDPSAKQATKKAIPLYRELAEQHLTHAASYQRSYDSTDRNSVV